MNMDDLSGTLQDACGLKPDDRLILGVSGGPDSLVLLHAMVNLGYRPLVAHLDHGLRPESAQDAIFVAGQAQILGLSYHGKRVEVAAIAWETGQSLEEAAREQRYRFLFDLAKQEGAEAVAVAHNADDQVETVLMHLLRGAGAAGLSGMQMRTLPNPWSDSIPLIRPLLGVWRSEIEAYCRAQALTPLTDPTNQDQNFLRNRLRHELIPNLQSYNPAVKIALTQTAEILRADRALHEELMDGVWGAVVRRQGEGHLGLDRRGLIEQPLALQRMLLRRAFSVLRPASRDLDFEGVQRALEAIAKDGASAKEDWAGGLYLLAEGEVLWIAAWGSDPPMDWPQLVPDYKLCLELPASVDLGQGWRLTAEQIIGVDDIRERALSNADPFQAWLDAERTGAELMLRTRRPGDRFQPLGMQTGSQKLADFMINVHLPERARAGWPLLCRENEILWVPGFRTANASRLLPESDTAVHLQMGRI